jgi:hypothetical protein
MKYLLILIALLLVGCSNKTNTVNIVQKCENTFVLSGYGYEILLFEHEDNSTKFNLLKSFNHGKNAFYDCKRNIIVAIQNKNKKQNEGIITFNLSNNTKKLYKTNEGFNGIVAKYKNGFIYSTASVKNAIVDEAKYGCIPKENIFLETYILDPKNKNFIDKQQIIDYKNGKLWYHYVDNYFFDLDRQKISKNYPYGMIHTGEIINNILFSETYGGYLEINLDKVYSKDFYSSNIIFDKSTMNLLLPKNSIRLFVNGIYYIITSSKSWDTATSRTNTKAVKFKRGAIYQIHNKKLSFVITLPFDDIVYVNSPNKKYLYIFTKSRKVIKYNIKQNKIIHISKLKIKLDKKFELSTVGFTEDNFIISFEEDRYKNAYIVLSDRNFIKFSKPYNIKMGGINISTEKSIHTNYMRVNNL